MTYPVPYPVPSSVMGLLQLLPPAGEPWPEKEAWLKALEATIHAVYPDQPADEQEVPAAAEPADISEGGA